LTADAGIARGTLYHNVGDKKGLLAVIVAPVDLKVALRAQQAAISVPNECEALLLEGAI